MWTTLFVMAIAVSLEPVRVGLAVVMLNRPRPVLQLAAFLCGGFVMGFGVGVAVLGVLHAVPVMSNGLTVPRVQIAIGLLALTAAAALAGNVTARCREVRLASATARGDGPGAAAVDPVPSARDRLSTCAKGLFGGSSLWVAGISGLGIALPSVDYLAALAVIHASNTSARIQLAALLGFNLVAFSLVVIPLLCYLVAPKRTLVAMAALNDWVRARSRRDIAAILAVAGLLMIGLGVVGL